MTMSDFAQYFSDQQDETPLYLFDDDFGNTAPSLLDGYEVPHIFSDDLFSYLGDYNKGTQFVLRC